jgi:hypothetical protein
VPPGRFSGTSRYSGLPTTGAGRVWRCAPVTVRPGRRPPGRGRGRGTGAGVPRHRASRGSRHLFPGAVRDARAHGLRLISYDRPGQGMSVPQPGRIVADCAEDVRAIVAHLGISRAAVWGHRSGARMPWRPPRCCPRRSPRYACSPRLPLTGRRPGLHRRHVRPDSANSAVT